MAVELKIPSVGESVTNVTISQWLKKDGEYVEMDEAVAELESDKATVELNATAAGTLKITTPEGSDVEIGTVVASIDTSAAAPAKAEKPVAKTETPAPEPVKQDKPQEKAATADSYAKGTPSPAAARILAEKGISPSLVTGSGPGGRITRQDAVLANAEAFMQQSLNGEVNRNVRREKMSNLRKTVARRLVSAKNETAMLTTFNEVNMQPIFDIRAKYKDKFKEKHGVGLGFMSFFARACVIALQKFPAVNAYIDGNEIEYHDYMDISIAVSGPKGLMVPVIRNAQSLAMHQIEQEVVRLATRVRDGKIGLDEMEGGTFTITNGGVFGSMLSTPIINPPQSAILGMHNIVERPVAENGAVVIRPVMYVALSYDHRIIDGRESVGFLVTVKNLLENPENLITGDNPLDLLLGM